MAICSHGPGLACAMLIALAGSVSAKTIELGGSADFFPDSADWTLKGRGYHLFVASSFWPGTWLCKASSTCELEGIGYADSSNFQITGEWAGRSWDPSTPLFASLRAHQSAALPDDLSSSEFTFPVDITGQIVGPGLDLRIFGRGQATNAVLAGNGTVAILALDHLTFSGTITEAPEPASLLPVAAAFALIAIARRRARDS